MTKEFKNLVDMQERCCSDFAERELFGTKKDGSYQWITYGEFGKLVDEFRGGLVSLDVKQGDKVAVIANNRVEWAVGVYASCGVGAHYVPMYEAQLPKDWKYILNDSAAVVVLTSTMEIYNKVKEIQSEVPSLKHVICFEAEESESFSYEALLKVGKENPVASIDPPKSEVAGLIYTSGTTGNPKGVILSHGNFISNVNAVHQILPMSKDDRSLSFLPWAHSFGQTAELHVLLSVGASLGLVESIATLMENLQEVRPTLLFSVPRIFNRIYDSLQKKIAAGSPVKRFLFEQGVKTSEKRRALSNNNKKSAINEMAFSFFDKVVFSKVKEKLGGNLKFAFSGGAALNAEVATFIDNVGITVYEGYGLTETTPICSGNYPGTRKIGTIGKPIPGVEMFICDEKQNILPNGEDGEIVVIGPNVMVGYHNLEKETNEAIIQLDGRRAFRTGDKGRYDEEGFIRITGRFKEQYKLENGKYVVPSPIEEGLKLSGFINQICIYGFNKPFNVAIVVPDFEAVKNWAAENGISESSDEELTKNEQVKAMIMEEIKKFGEKFKRYELPREIALIAEEFTPQNGLLTPTLKLKRNVVNEQYATLLSSLYP